MEALLKKYFSIKEGTVFNVSEVNEDTSFIVDLFDEVQDKANNVGTYMNVILNKINSETLKNYEIPTHWFDDAIDRLDKSLKECKKALISKVK